jgi:hypothetical protein
VNWGKSANTEPLEYRRVWRLCQTLAEVKQLEKGKLSVELTLKVATRVGTRSSPISSIGGLPLARGVGLFWSHRRQWSGRIAVDQARVSLLIGSGATTSVGSQGCDHFLRSANATVIGAVRG